MKISKIQDSISILITLQAAIDECLAVIKKESHDKNSKVFAFVSGQLFLYAHSFLDEWENLGNQCINENGVLKVRRIVSPLIKRVRQWTDLNSFRNVFLAHNFRDKEKNNALVKNYSNELNIPNGFADYVLLSGCIFYIKQMLIKEFASEYNELVIHLRSIKTPVIKKGIESEQQALNELNMLIDQCELLKAGLR